jgi:hypothetical protein
VLALGLAAGGVALAVSLSGGSSGEQDDSSAESVAAEQARRADERRAAQAKFDTCEQQMGDLLESLSELDSRLDVGLNYSEYTNAVGDVRVEYDQVPFDDANDPTCITTVGLPAEAAFNQYVKATRVWNDCFEDFNCSNDSIEPALHRHWEKASRSVEKARDGLDSMRPAS